MLMPRSAYKTAHIVEYGDLDIYVAWTLWLRYIECVPKSFLLPDGEEKVLAYIRAKLRRPELTAKETELELWWQVERMLEECGDVEDEWWVGSN